MNSFQLVMRFDTFHDYYKVGWAAELPLGRFTHTELITERNTHAIIQTDEILALLYQQACIRAADLNKHILKREIEEKRGLNWYSVPLNIDDDSIEINADEFGSFFQLASNTRYRLSKNCFAVWAVINRSIDTAVLCVRSRYPNKSLSELQYQIWKNQQKTLLSGYNGELTQGKLIACHSGLWFCADT